MGVDDEQRRGRVSQRITVWRQEVTNHSPSRRPPVVVRRQLRQEVGFGCPVAGCGNPYLEYHHFDPTWRVRPHHSPDGMLALCATHHAKADALTAEQCRDLKRGTPDSVVRGRFEWMRREIVAIVGGNYYHETPRVVVFENEPIIWFERDADGYLQLSIRMLTASREPRTALLANDWIIDGDPVDVESPPNGSYLRVTYENGDDVQVRFREWESSEMVGRTHPAILGLGNSVTYPLVTAEVAMVVAGTQIRFDAKSSQIGGITMTGNVMSRSGTGLAIE